MDPNTGTRSGTNEGSKKKKLLYPSSLGAGIESLSIRRKSSSSSPSSPRKERFSTEHDISDEPVYPTSPLSSSFAAGNGTGTAGEKTRLVTIPKMTVRRTSSLEADLVLAPLPRDKLLRMRRWILGLAIVNFDLDLGPVVDVLYPEALIDNPGRENIAFSSFPDSAIFESGSEVHSFRIRDPTLLPPSTSSSSATPTESRSSLLSLVDEADGGFETDGFIYGYALFHQRKDGSSRRGYLQRSVVILSQHPYPSLFIACLAELAPMYFSRGAPALETACHNIANWPAPTPGLACELGFMGAVLSIELPLNITYHQLSQHSRPPSTSSLLLHPHTFEPTILASLPSDPSTRLPSPIRLFERLLGKIWSLWECLVLCEPVILFAKTPRDASLAVWWLMEIMKPLPLAIDYRPYFHIHDVDFDRLLGPSASAQLAPLPPSSSSTPSSSTPAPGTQAPRGVLLGVTNPFFETIVKRAGWPHVVSLGDVLSDSDSSLNDDDSSKKTEGGGGGGANGGGMKQGNGRDLGGRGMMAALDLSPPLPTSQDGEKEKGRLAVVDEHGRRAASDGSGTSTPASGNGNGSGSMGMRRSTSGKGSLTSRLASPARERAQHIRRASAQLMGSSSSSPSPQPPSASTSAPQPKPQPKSQPQQKRAGALDLGPAPGFHTKHARYISKDREVLKVLEGAVGKGGDVEARAVHVLRQHFSQRASEVLVPLNRYFTSLISSSTPTPASSSSHLPIYASHRSSGPSSSSTPSSTLQPPQNATTMRLPPFSPTAFLASLKTHGSPLPFRTRAKQKEFYEKWLRSPAFGVWMRERDEEARRALGGR